jgi:predicted TIM-barrel fold metal-dependent hydrolase
VFGPYGRLPGGNSDQLDARMRDMEDDGIDRELAFPNAVLALLQYPDFEVRELCFRIYNQYVAGLQARHPGRFYAVGLINWWDPKGTRQTLEELKALGLKTFLMPLSPGATPDGERIDYASMRMNDVWGEIEASGVPVSHHIGEIIGSPCEFNMMTISFVHSVAPFRDMFARYIFGGILDRHPGLQIGWFEGGINWVASAMQDAEHAHASFWHMNNLKIEHAPDHYWRRHMCASFIVDPLGLEMIDRLGADRIMWSADYPHNESSFGYSRSSLNQVARTVGADRAPAVVGGNIARFLKV